jgi:hypothetical protein
MIGGLGAIGVIEGLNRPPPIGMMAPDERAGHQALPVRIEG